ncbi:MAG: hypothetical protein QNK27_08625, partial [Desulfuromusa sp.]|nr:hypothetical protein [Desulfuromusa sp.]
TQREIAGYRQNKLKKNRLNIKSWHPSWHPTTKTKKGLTAQCRKSLICMAPFAGLEPATI